MPGTKIDGLKLNKVVDGDTIKVEINGEVDSLRLVCLDTEESWPGGSKPVTNAGKQASQWAKEYFGVNGDGVPDNDIFVDIEFDTNDPANICLEKHRGNYGRLICYVYMGGENYNIKYVYVSGQASLWPPDGNGKPQIVLTDKNQILDLPPGWP